MSEVLAEKTTTIGGAKDLAMDLQKRANDLAGLASNKLSFLSGKFCLQLDDLLNTCFHEKRILNFECSRSF